MPNASVTNTNLFAIRRFLDLSGFPVLGADGVVGLLGAVLVDALGSAIGDVGCALVASNGCEKFAEATGQAAAAAALAAFSPALARCVYPSGLL